MDLAAGDLLRAARWSAGLTQRDLAAKASVPQPTIAAIESGRRQPGVGLLVRILGAAGARLTLEPAEHRSLTLAELGGHLARTQDDSTRFRLVIEFLDEFRATPESLRASLVAQRPASTNSLRWDAMLGALAEHCAFHSGLSCPDWAFEPRRYLARSWYPTNLPSVRATAVASSPAAFRIRGIFIDDAELESA